MVYPDDLDEYHPEIGRVIMDLTVIRAKETPVEWKERILPAIKHFRNKKMIPSSGNNSVLCDFISSHYIQANRSARLYDNGYFEIDPLNVAICLYCDQLVYIDGRIEERIVMEMVHYKIKEHWRTKCTGNGFRTIGFEKYLNLKNRSNVNNLGQSEIYIYELWLENATAKLKRAREVGKRIRAATIIQKKWLEFMYRPNGIVAVYLATHYNLLKEDREIKRQIVNA